MQGTVRIILASKCIPASGLRYPSNIYNIEVVSMWDDRKMLKE
jgi:hypothetical protein